MKYIDAEKLKAEIYLIPTVCDRHYADEWERGRDSGFIQVISIIESLQQEQPEVDLEKEIDDWYNTVGIPVTADALKETAHHFFELGLRTRKEEVK